MGSINGSMLKSKNIPTAGGIPNGDSTTPNVVALKIAGPAVLAIEDRKLVIKRIINELKLIGILYKFIRKNAIEMLLIIIPGLNMLIPRGKMSSTFFFSSLNSLVNASIAAGIEAKLLDVANAIR